jgi:ubiquinone/menaquinone biosynthesis C-methylase UbiE
MQRLKTVRTIDRPTWGGSGLASRKFGEASFDLVLCRQGLWYFSDRTTAMREMVGVLAPGGRIVLNVWAADAQCVRDEVTRPEWWLSFEASFPAWYSSQWMRRVRGSRLAWRGRPNPNAR